MPRILLIVLLFPVTVPPLFPLLYLSSGFDKRRANFYASLFEEKGIAPVMLGNGIIFREEKSVVSGQEESTELARLSALVRVSQELQYASDTPTWSPT